MCVLKATLTYGTMATKSITFMISLRKAILLGQDPNLTISSSENQICNARQRVLLERVECYAGVSRKLAESLKVLSRRHNALIEHNSLFEMIRARLLTIQVVSMRKNGSDNVGTSSSTIRVILDVML